MYEKQGEGKKYKAEESGGSGEKGGEIKRGKGGEVKRRKRE